MYSYNSIVVGLSYQTLVKFCFQDKIFEYIINHLQFGIKIAVHLRGEFGIKHGIAECRGYSWGLYTQDCRVEWRVAWGVGGGRYNLFSILIGVTQFKKKKTDL